MAAKGSIIPSRSSWRKRSETPPGGRARAPRPKNKTLICLPMKTKGVEIARKLDKLGMRSSDTAQIFFDNVRIPQRFLIGEEGKGFTYQIMQFQEERLWAAAANLKAMERVIEQT